MNTGITYDAVIVGAGHNGLIAACYLAMAGKRVLMLEKNTSVGGATRSMQLFPGVEARVSVYSYLISLLPGKILRDLQIPLEIRRRPVASYSPVNGSAGGQGLLISNVSEDVTRQSFIHLFGNDREYHRYQKLQEKITIFAQKVWPTLLSPLPTREELRSAFRSPEERAIWADMIEKPLASFIEDHLSTDLVRGAVFTDAKIGVLTHPDDPTLLQNRTFLYHVIGQGTGEWCVPVGGMGALVEALDARARALGVEIRTGVEVNRVYHALPASTVHFTSGDREELVDSWYVLFNASSDVANRCLEGTYAEGQVDGSVFKINMVLKRLPQLKDRTVSPVDAFSGTFHINEGYENMRTSYRRAQAGDLGEDLPGEMYCHSLTDPSILSPDLQARGYQTLTLFGLDVPYAWFGDDHDRRKALVLDRFLHTINRLIEGDFRDCLAVDANGNLCIEAKSPIDLEMSLGLPKGNIFHGNLTWPFAESAEEAGAWGVETAYQNVLICGSSAKRGGAVSGIPGHNAAMKVLASG